MLRSLTVTRPLKLTAVVGFQSTTITDNCGAIDLD